MFIRDYLQGDRLEDPVDKVRVAKEFVKFNERCSARLLGDMHSGNWVVDLTPDFDQTAYRIRAIDFDQQSYEGRANVYLPQYYKENNALVFLAMETMDIRTVRQYQGEERTLIGLRARSESERLGDLLSVMCHDRIAPDNHVRQLAAELARERGRPQFAACRCMGELVQACLQALEWAEGPTIRP